MTLANGAGIHDRPKQAESLIITDVTIYYLQMTQRSQLQAKVAPAGLTVECVTPASGAVNQQYYREVGAAWAWQDRLSWSLQQWRDYAERDVLSTWIAQYNGDEIGYAELERQDGGDVELRYFGLLPAFIGRGLGAALLTRMVEIAWSLPDARRVWVHTCTNDHPYALANYTSRGFAIYRTQFGAA